jgi:hypothetical protein
MQYCSPTRKFRISLPAAKDELERAEIIAGGRIALSTKGFKQAVWTRLCRDFHRRSVPFRRLERGAFKQALSGGTIAPYLLTTLSFTQDRMWTTLPPDVSGAARADNVGRLGEGLF